jgi:hypothetical protein
VQGYFSSRGMHKMSSVNTSEYELLNPFLIHREMIGKYKNSFSKVTTGKMRQPTELKRLNLNVTFMHKKTKLHGVSPQANYTNQATAICQQS